MGFGRSPMDIVVESTIKDIITAEYKDLDSVLSRSAVLNYDLLQPHRVLVGTFSHDIKSIRGQLVRAVQAIVGQDGLSCCIGEEVVILARAEVDHLCLAEKIIADIDTQFKLKIYIGIGSIVSSVDNYAPSYQVAKKALNIGAYNVAEGQIRSFDQLKIHALFLTAIKQEELYKFAKEQVGALVDYDERNNTKLCKTLQEFLYLRNNIERTARKLNLSVSGLKYRLRKIESILSMNLNDYNGCFDVQLAFIIMQLFGDYTV